MPDRARPWSGEPPPRHLTSCYDRLRQALRRPLELGLGVSICSFANCSSPKLAELHPVDPFGNRDFGMLVISDFATEKPCSVFPLQGIARAPSDLHLTRNRLYCSVALACLPPLAPR